MPLTADDIALILSGVEILQDLEVDAINDIAGNIRAAKFARSDKLVEEGEPGQRLYIIFSGTVEVHVPAQNAREAKTIPLKKGAVVGEMSMLTGRPYSADVVALGDTTALYINRKKFHELIQKHQSFAECMSNLMSERIAENGEIQQVGKYKIRGKLGEGAMAVVFDAYDTELEREVAIKMLKYELAYESEFLQRFEREAKTIAGLQHPHIVNVIEIIKDYSTSFIVMEKLVGDNLSDVMDEQGSFSQEDSRQILFQVANALQYAHEQGIVHRDIKPANIVMDAHGNVKLTDFGVSGPPQHKDVNIEGTPYFLAPEVISGKLVDGRADIYAMGVMAFYMLSNKLPFTASTIDELHAKQMADTLPDIRDHCADLSREFVGFVTGTLSNSPEERLQDWDEIRTILSASGEAIDPSLGYDQIELVLRMNQVSLEQCQQVIKMVKQSLTDQGIPHSIEMQRGEVDISL
ncbi:MAG: protein kinase [Pseudomonadota bacterium]